MGRPPSDPARDDGAAQLLVAQFNFEIKGCVGLFNDGWIGLN
jgi:hypothetical protein